MQLIWGHEDDVTSARIIESPVLILLLAALLGKPRKMKVSMLFMTWLAMVFTVFIVAVYALSFITGLFY